LTNRHIKRKPATGRAWAAAASWYGAVQLKSIIAVKQKTECRTEPRKSGEICTFIFYCACRKVWYNYSQLNSVMPSLPPVTGYLKWQQLWLAFLFNALRRCDAKMG